MNYFIAGILRIILLEAGGALLVFRPKARKAIVAFLVLAAIGLFSWTRFGEFRGDGAIVHRWEQFHFYFAAKYLPEIRYDNLYKAILIAEREDDPGARDAPLGVTVTRDLTNFEEIPVRRALVGADAVRARFSDEKWAEFKKDWGAMKARGGPWSQILKDHGNTSSPAWALLATPIAKMVPCSEGGEKVLAVLDVILMLGLFAMILRTFGARTGSVAIWIFAFVPVSFDYLFGSFLRWDWLFAVGMSVCFWKRGRPATAGAFLAYAVASKLFPFFFALGLAVPFVREVIRTRRVPTRYVRFAAGALICGGCLFGLSSAMFGGTAIWKDYAARIEVANHEKYYPNQYSLQTVFLQAVATANAPVGGSIFMPPRIKQELKEVDVQDFAAPLLATRIVLTLLLLAFLLRAGEIEAMTAGPFFVFVWLTVNAYYWNMLMLPALGWAARRNTDGRMLAPLLGLHAMLMTYYLYQHTNHGYAEGYFTACMMLILFVVWGAGEAFSWWKRPGWAAAS